MAAKSEVGRPDLASSALFRLVWVALVDLLGSAATAALVNRAARRAKVHSPELASLAITRIDQEYGYELPPSFERTQGLSVPLRNLLAALRALLVEQTGMVALQRLGRVPELKAWVEEIQ
jgi:hypothetical protein